MRHKAWSRAIPSSVAIIVMASVLLFIRAEFAQIVAPKILNIWLGYMAVCVLLLIATFFTAVIPRWRAARSRLFRVRLGQVASLSFCAGIVASIWILMPPANDVLRLLMVVLCMWFVAMVIVLNGDRLSVIGSVAVAASMVAFTLVYDIRYALPLAGFITMEGVALVMIRRMLWRAAETLEEALGLVQAQRDAKTRFIAAASHDLQQPIQAASLLFDLACDADRPVNANIVRTGRAAFASVSALLDEMLGYLRLSSGVMPTRAAEHSLADLLAEVSDRFRLRDLGGMELRWVTSSLRISTDRDLLCRALVNLVENAVRHSGAKRVLIGVRRCHSMVRLWVIDNGSGIPPESRSGIFDAFVQGTRQRSEISGFGLGLPSAALIASHLGGRLFLDDRGNIGAAFCIELPLADPLLPDLDEPDFGEVTCAAA